MSSKPPDWFGIDYFALLVQYCQIAARHKKLVLVVNELDGQVPAELVEQKYIYAAATKLEERILRHARAAAVLAARLRLSVQAAVDRRSRMLERKAPAIARSLACGWASRLPTGVTLSPRA